MNNWPYINDRLVVWIFFLFLEIYTIFYEELITHGLGVTELNTFLLVIFIPIIFFDFLKTAVESFFAHNYYEGTEDLSKITVIIATRNGASSLPLTLNDVLRRFPPTQVIVASNGSTDATCDIAREHGVLVMDIKEGIGKVFAINRAVMQVQTPYVLPIDDDTLIGDALLPTSALDTLYDGVAFRVYPIQQNWLTTMQMHEYRKSMDIGRSYHNKTATVQTISGAIGLFRTSELIRQIDLHTGEFCGEDLQRTLLIHLANPLRGVVLSRSKVVTFVPNTPYKLMFQRILGWNPGLYANLHNYIKLIFQKSTPTRLRIDAIYSTIVLAGLDILRLWAFPILVFYPVILIAVYATYVAIEFIPYFVLGAQEPVWVVFLFPIYGLFECMSRLAALAVFIYRRLTVVFAKLPYWDDYRRAPLSSRYASLLLVTLLLVVTGGIGLLVHSGVLRATVETNLQTSMRGFMS